MKRSSYVLLVCFIVAQIFVACKNEKVKDPVDYVNPNIGTIGHLLVATESMVQLPHGMVQTGQNPYPEIGDRYLADKIYSFSLRALPRYGIKTVPSWIMATTGKAQVKAGEIASAFDHDFETVTPYFSSVILEDYKITVETTVTEHASYYQFLFPKSDESHILLGYNSKIKIVGNNAVEAVENMGKGQKAYFYAEFSKPFSSAGTWKGIAISSQPEQLGDSIGVLASFSTATGEKVGVKVGVSYIDVEQARQNLKNEIPEWNFDQTKNRAKDIWNQALGKIQIEGGTEAERIKFYSALYRVMLGNQSVNLTEYGRYYSRFDSAVHSTDGHDFYRVASNWGSHHSLFPLFLLVEPDKQNDMLRSYVRMEELGDWLSNSGGYRNMIGRHEVATITDAYLKGFRDFDVEKAYSGMKRNSLETTMLSRHLGSNFGLTELDQVYLEKGFFPAIPSGEKEWVPQVGFGRQAVAITLENCYDDWCMALMAKQLGKNDDYAYFLKRAHNYENVFDPATGFMRPKTADGKWIEPFDPIWSGGQGGRDYYTENNGWNYTWYVPHDVNGLVKLMGGRGKFVQKLNTLFTTTVPLYSKFKFLGQYPDMTGWIGMYSHGNEITWHIPYLYNYAGAPWMTQRRVRQIMDLWYGTGPLGMCGDEDYGEMSSWYVLSAMGFYTVSPGSLTYDIGSPLFSRSVIDIGNGKKFVVEAKNVSKQNKYIQSAELNGKSIDRPWFSHEELMQGGKLVLNMGPLPNKVWGSSAEAAPPSMTR
jgi:predicted alpha-1,2-mannosidase